MADLQEKEIAEQIDREISSSDGLLALVLCLSVSAGLGIAVIASYFSAFA